MLKPTTEDRVSPLRRHRLDKPSPAARLPVRGRRYADDTLVFPATAADGYVTEGPALGPVPAARLAEVPRLGEVVVVVVTELRVGRITPGAPEVLVLHPRRCRGGRGGWGGGGGGGRRGRRRGGRRRGGGLKRVRERGFSLSSNE